MSSTAARRFQELVDILKRLRGADGCPWDREQTFASLRPYLLEETYEILESIDQERYAELQEELGDLLLHIAFQAQIAEELGLFDFAEVLSSINQKLIRRHPHVFGDIKVENARQVEKNWESLKLKEPDKTVLGGVPKQLPALLRAFRVQEKAAGVGFDWENVQDVLNKVKEEIEELQTALAQGQQDKVVEEFGDLLFALVNLGRFWRISPEEALRGTVEKFMRRFNYIETELKAQGRDIHKSSLQEMDRLWEEAKGKGV